MQPTILNTIADKHEEQLVLSIPFHDLSIHAHLYMPPEPTALVIISHGSGSSRVSPKNNYVARSLSNDNMAALLVDLLTTKEDNRIKNRFDIPLLTERLTHVTKWAMHQSGLRGLPVGYLGISTGAASALNAAAVLYDKIKAVVCAGGRTDLVKDSDLALVSCPTLFIVGGLDNEVLKLNRKVFPNLKCKKSIFIINSASHSFEEPGKMHFLSELASGWFEKYLV